MPRPARHGVAWLCAAAALLCIVHSRVAAAQTAVCSTPSDCDGDGTPNLQDPCPAPAAGTTFDSTIRHGFRDVRCYARIMNALATGSGCIPVAVRPFERDVPVDPTDPASAIDHRVGFTWVGVLDKQQAVAPDAKMNQLIADAASPAEVETSFRDTTPDAEPVPNALFACLQSVEIQPTRQAHRLLQAGEPRPRPGFPVNARSAAVIRARRTTTIWRTSSSTVSRTAHR